MKVIIVGGVAGGASCAARLRRMDEEVEIYPLARRARVRSLQVHGEKAQVARAGQRTAVEHSDVFSQ